MFFLYAGPKLTLLLMNSLCCNWCLMATVMLKTCEHIFLATKEFVITLSSLFFTKQPESVWFFCAFHICSITNIPCVPFVRCNAPLPHHDLKARNYIPPFVMICYFPTNCHLAILSHSPAMSKPRSVKPYCKKPKSSHLDPRNSL